MNILITAGPTREYIDPVRFITNASSGRQGIAIAKEAKKKGYKVILVLGPGTVAPPINIKVIRITAAKEMLKTVLKYKKWMDVLVMAAAVGDWQVVKKNKQKIKKTSKILNLKLIQNSDVIACIGKLKKERKTKTNLFLVGFSIDSKNSINNAKKKLKNKNLDIIVANPLKTFNSIKTKPVIISKKGTILKLPTVDKSKLAVELIKIISKRKHDLDIV